MVCFSGLRPSRRLRLLSTTAVCAALALGLTGPVAAQQAQTPAAASTTPAGGGAVVDLDTVTVTATRTESSVVDTMAGASVVTSDQIKRSMPGSISQMLRDVPGVTSQISPNDPGQSINIRGLQDFGRVNVLVDGARQDYQISGHNANGTFYLDPEFISQADVVRGPVANIYGSGAIGGVVSFRTRGIDDLLKPDERYGASQRIVSGTNGAGFATSTSAGARYGTAADVFGQFLYRNTNAYHDGADKLVPDTGTALTGGLLKFNLRPTEYQKISVSAMQQQYRFTNNGTSLTGTRFSDDVRTGNYTLGYSIKSPENPWVDFDSRVYYSTTDNRQKALKPSTTYAALGVVPGDRLSDRIGTWGFDVHNTARFDTGPVSHALTIGGDSAWDHVKTIDNAGGYVSALTPGGDRRISGAFVQDELRYGGWLRVLGALRYDNFDLSGNGVDNSGSHVSPKITVGVTPFSGVEFYGTYAEGYRAPSITETLIAGTHPFPAFVLLPNPLLKPETAHNFEAGVNVKYDNVLMPGDSFRGKATAFTNRVDNYIDLADSGTSTTVCFIPGLALSTCRFIPGATGSIASQQYQNVARARLQGVELEAGYDWGRGFVSLSGSAVNGRNLVTHTALATVSPYRASATLGFRFLDNNALTIGTRLSFVGDSAKNIGTTTLTPSKGYALVDLFASYAYSERVSADLTINNVFDRRYTQYLYSQPDPGLTAKLGITVKFASR